MSSEIFSDYITLLYILIDNRGAYFKDFIDVMTVAMAKVSLVIVTAPLSAMAALGISHYALTIVSIPLAIYSLFKAAAISLCLLLTFFWLARRDFDMAKHSVIVGGQIAACYLGVWCVVSAFLWFITVTA